MARQRERMGVLADIEICSDATTSKGHQAVQEAGRTYFWREYSPTHALVLDFWPSSLGKNK